MNKSKYRIIFNQSRGQYMAVCEVAAAQGKDAGQSERSGTGMEAGLNGLNGSQSMSWSEQLQHKLHRGQQAFGALGLKGSLIVALSALPAALVWAQVVAAPGAPANQRPVIVTAGNGVPVVNIQTATTGGVSMNLYSQFNVGTNGVILNNSSGNAQTQLGGWIQGNTHLANGTARLIVNQVTSTSPSALNGYLEVAGQRAGVVIANPNGIAVSGGGFINAQSVTLTTGVPNFNGNTVTGYTVNQGSVSISGNGLDTSTADYTSILSRGAQINGGIWAKQLAVVTGANQIDAAVTQGAKPTAAGMVSAIAGMGAAPSVAIDVSNLGGMYAGKIFLMGTEAGLGVRNAGSIMGLNSSAYAGPGEVTLSNNGWVSNSHQIQSAGALALQAVGDVSNSGTAYSGSSASVSSAGNINNTGVLAALGNVALSATGVNSRISSSTGAVLAAGMKANGALSSVAQTLSIQATQDVSLNGQTYVTGDATVQGSALNLTGATLYANNANLSSTSGAVDASTVTMSVLGTLDINSAASVSTNQAVVSASNLNITGTALSNAAGQLQANDLNVNVGAGTVNNTAGSIYAANSATLAAGNLNNSNTSTAGLGIDVGILNLTLTGQGTQLDNSSGSIHSAGNTRITASGTLNNTNGNISAGGNLSISDTNASNPSNPSSKTLSITNTGGNLLAGGNVAVDAASDTGDGKISAGTDLSLKLSGGYSIAATGEVSSSGTTDLQITGNLTNRGLIDGVNTWIVAGNLTNTGTGRIYGDKLAIQTGTLNNTSETVGGSITAASLAARNRLDIGATNVYNSEHGLIFSDGDINIGGSLNAQHQATGQATLVRNGSANIEASGNITINAASIVNVNDHFAYNMDSAVLTEGNLYADYGDPGHYYRRFNRYVYQATVTQDDPSVITAGGNITLSGNSISNQQSKIIAGGALTAVGGSIDNTQVQASVRTQDLGTQWNWGVVGGHDECYPCKWKLDWGWVQTTYDNSIYTTVNVSSGRTLAHINPNTAAARDLNTTAVENVTFVRSNIVNNLNRSVSPTTPIKTSVDSGGKPSVNPGAGSGINVSNNSLFRTPGNSNANYLVETDPRFANYRTWLSSDYLFTSLGVDPATQQKRLGDGFYEQRMIREQIGQLTGQRFLAGYSNEQDEYLGLMNNAATAAHAMSLRPGIALTAEQVAQLTSDIVWLVERSVTLPDGRVTTALVPQVYTRVRDSDLDSSGALLSGSVVNLQSSGSVNTSGTVMGRRLVAMSGKDVNIVGAVLGGRVSLQSQDDINVRGGTVKAEEALLARAGRNLNVTTTTSSNQSGTHSSSTVDRVAGLYVSSASGSMELSALGDVNLTAATLNSAGSAQVQAGGGVNLNAITTGSADKFGELSGDHLHMSQSSQTGTRLETGANLAIAANRNITGVAANLQAQGRLDINAGGNVSLTEGRSSRSSDVQWTEESNGLLSSSSSTTQIKSSESRAIEGQVSGAQGVNITAGGGVLLSAQQVQARGGDVNISGTEVQITSALNSESSSRREERTGQTLGTSNGGESSYDRNSTTLAATSISGQNVRIKSADQFILAAVNISATGTPGTGTATTANTPGQVSLEADQLTLATLTTSQSVSTSSKTSDLLTQSSSGAGQVDQSTQYTSITGQTNIKANSVTVGMSVKDSAAALAGQPGMGWITVLQNDPKLGGSINWEAVQEAHQRWDYSQSGLSATGAALVSIALACATGGAGASLVGATAGSMGAAAASAAFTSLVTQATISLANNGGNLDRTLQQMGTNESMRGLATSMATAAAMSYVSDMDFMKEMTTGADGLPIKYADQTLPNKLLIGVTNSAMGALVSTGINGGSLENNLIAATRAGMVQALSAQAANGLHLSPDEMGDVAAQIQNKLGHALIGCAVASGSGKCSSGATGAVVGEIAAELMSGGEASQLSNQGQQMLVNNARLIAAGIAAVAGLDPNVAATAATNAVENNFLSNAHKLFTLNAAKSAGLSQKDAIALANAVKNADFVTGSQDPKNAHWHSMCSAGDSTDACETKQSEFLMEKWNSKSIDGFAQFLHAVQDSSASGHQNKVWPGGLPSREHIEGDMYPAGDRARQIENQTSSLVKAYKEFCPQCFPTSK
jgi:filamentous hemagglutinin